MLGLKGLRVGGSAFFNVISGYNWSTRHYSPVSALCGGPGDVVCVQVTYSKSDDGCGVEVI